MGHALLDRTPAFVLGEPLGVETEHGLPLIPMVFLMGSSREFVLQLFYLQAESILWTP